MVHNNKVLTVSYGTFSCTLEGFDDSFGTMKAIAEYFRDLASDDRYFGAEPPQPDADMLARIAQREIARQVEAHSTEPGRIVLRAADIAPAPAEITETEVAAPAPAAVAEPVQEPTMEPEVAEIEAPEVEVAQIVAKQAAAIEADAAEAIVVAPVVVEPVAIDPVPVEEPTADEPIVDPVEDEIEVEDVVEVEDTEVAEVEAEAPAAIVVEEPSQPEIEAVVEADPTPVDITPEPESEPEAVPAADSIAAKLQRIRAVVSQNDTLVQMDDYTEDQHADGFIATADKDDSELEDADEDIQDTQDSDNEILQVLTQLDTGDEDIVEPTDDNIEDDSAFDNMGADTQPEDDFEEYAEPAEDIFADEPLVMDEALFDVPEDGEDELTEDSVADDVPEAAADDATDEDSAQPQARLVKVKRADLETAIASGQLEQVDGSDDVVTGSLSAEDEADLMRELAEVEAEATDVSDSDEAEDNIFGEDIVSEVDDEQDEDADAQRTLSQSVSEDEADLTRLMAEADEKLDDPATSSNRDTYSHLRAAVAAAEAEQSAGGQITDQTQDDDYRDDLANVVRPRRTAIESQRVSRPAVQSRPAPLKLVAEQRVDEGASPKLRGPVRPRRVMTVPAPEALSSDTTNNADTAFAEFATRMGATELPDLLEAAAAYLSFVEGHDKFSRPQLMNKVRMIQQDNFNREDGLRSFGQLLRDGKIVKRGGGRFAASSDIGFRPDDREAEAG